MSKFHLADREPVALAIEAANRANTLKELYDEISAYKGHDVAEMRPYTPSQGVMTSSPLMIVTEKPEKEDLDQKRPFSGEYGAIMRNAAGMIGVDLDECHISYAIHWTPEGDKSPNKTQIAASRPFLYREIELVRPRAILAQGRAVIESLANYRGSVLDIYGQTMRFQHENLDVPMFLTAHPAYCLYSSTYFSTFMENTKEFFQRYGKAEENTLPGSVRQQASVHADTDLTFKRIKAA